ncbi:MAG: glutamate-1-semialdehyde 2,1-aminomutase [Deltaproteobacteria bacterium]|nr:glutamate-1-semialdehyde 2,1-aminomutase [Deltaproteobacteria bacterium]
MSMSHKLFLEAQKYLPGGVNSPVRAWRAVGGDPLFIQRGRGCRVIDADGQEYIDYVGSWGPLIVGHAHSQVVRALGETLKRGTSFGAPTPREIELAKILVEAVPSLEKVRLTSSGTEAAMTALRLARGYTGRTKIIKFAGCYHGHSDALLVRAGSGALTFSTPDSAGVPEAFASQTLVAEYNDLASVEVYLKAEPAAIAAVIVEPIPGNMGLVLPKPDFLAGLRSLTRAYGVVLIFDEVISGFRVARGGAQEIYGIDPDLTCLGKVIGGGLPLAAVGGKRAIMDLLSPLGPVYQAGTLSGNPLAVTAGIETLKLMGSPGAYARLNELGSLMAEGLRAAIQDSGIVACVNQLGSMFTVFFGVDQVQDYATATRSDTQLFARYFQGMIDRGIYLPPSQFETAFISLVHGEAEIEETLAAAKQVFLSLRS